MNRLEYIAFIEAFGCLSPYELDHISSTVHKRYNAGKKKKSLKKKDLQNILVAAMQDLELESAEKRLEEAKLNLALTKSRIYKKR